MDIYGNPSSHFVADFFGSPSMNLMDGDIAQARGKARFDNGLISMNLPKSAAGKYAGRGTLGIRPEHVQIGGKGPVAKQRISLVEPLGKDTLLYFGTTGERPLIAMVEGLLLNRYKVGDNVGLTFPADKIYLFDDAGKRL